MSLEQLSIWIEKVLDRMDVCAIYSITGDFFVKDPYCQVYKAIFSTMEEIAAKTAGDRRRRSLPALRGRGVQSS
jgi:hypothetical protein